MASTQQDRAHAVDADIYSEVLAAERAVVAACLVKPARIPEIAARVHPSDIVGKLHRQLLETLITIAEEGRTPSIEAIAATYPSEEVAPHISLRKYLFDIAKQAADGLFLPWEDAAEVVVDQSRRRRLAGIGSHLTQGTTLAHRISDLASEAITMIDDVLAEVRSERRLSYDAGDAGTAAIEHLNGADRAYPTTGLDDLDRALGGWPLGQLSVLAGRPGAGKSAVASSMLLRAAKAGHASAFYSLEMTKEQLGARMLTDFAYANQSPIYYEDILNRRKIDNSAARRLNEAQAKLAELPIYIEEQRGLTVSEIASRSRKIAAERVRAGDKLKLIFVDHMMLVRSTDRYSGNRVREVGEISEGLTLLAQELDVAIVALCQLNRGVEGRDNKRPTLSDLRDSGEVEQNASTVTFLYRPAYYLEQSKSDDPELEQQRESKLAMLKHTLELGIAKNRNGRVGVITAFVDIGANAVRNASFSH